MNRFQKSQKTWQTHLGTVFFLLLFLGIFLLFSGGIHSVSETTLLKQQESLENAIRKSAVHCYAVEGAYPESLDYLREHYGISYDEKRFLVDYEIIGSNLMPDIHVFLRKGSAS